jgi:CHAD domain-containing protein
MDPVTGTASAIELGADLTVGDGLKEMLSGTLGALHRRNSAAKMPGSEAVHRFRVGLRRLRSVLSGFADAFPDGERRALGDRLRSIAQRYGRAREWDVFLAHSVAPLRAAVPGENTLLVLQRLARRARRQAMPPGDTLRSNLEAIDAVVAEATWLRTPAPELVEVWERPLRDHAAQLLAKRHRKLRKRVKRADLADQFAFHELRIQVKKLRYPIELVKSVFDEEAADEYLERLVDLQDLLGRLNDAHLGSDLMRELDLPAPAQHLLTGWMAREIAACRERFPACGRSFRRAKPFWED